jgi:hypothetical protein
MKPSAFEEVDTFLRARVAAPDSYQAYTVLDFLERLLSDSRFQSVDYFLEQVDLMCLSAEGIVTVAAITFHGKASLRLRDAFMARAEPRLIELVGATRAENLLQRRR